MFLTAVHAGRGNLSGGIKNLHRLQAYFSENGQKWSAATVEYILGNIYFQLIQNEAPKDFKIIIKNIGFLYVGKTPLDFKQLPLLSAFLLTKMAN